VPATVTCKSQKCKTNHFTHNTPATANAIRHGNAARGAVSVGVRRTIHTKGTAANGTAIAKSPIGRNMQPKMTEDNAAYTAARSEVMGRSAEASVITGELNDYFPE
jgi:hypothetical protein